MWNIEDSNISVLKRPEVSNDRFQFADNLMTIVKATDKIRVLKTHGFAGTWKLVNVYDSNNDLYARGWINGNGVKKAMRIDEK